MIGFIHDPVPGAVRQDLADAVDLPFQDPASVPVPLYGQIAAGPQNLTERIIGTGIRYDFGDGPDLLGRRLADVRLSRGRLYERMRGGRGLVLFGLRWLPLRV